MRSLHLVCSLAQITEYIFGLPVQKYCGFVEFDEILHLNIIFQKGIFASVPMVIHRSDKGAEMTLIRYNSG